MPLKQLNIGGKGVKLSALLFSLAIACYTDPVAAADHLVIAQSNDSLIWAPLYVARKMGYFADEGIDIDVVLVKSGPAALTAVTTGGAQIALGFPATPIQAIAKGFKLEVFAELSNQFIAELVLRGDVAERLHLNVNSPIETRIRALKGLTIATNGTGSANDYLLRRILQDNGLHAESDVTITPIGAGPAILAALDQHRIDGYVATPPSNTIAVRSHAAVQLIDFAAGEYRPIAGIIYIALAASKDWLTSHRPLAARCVHALARALTLMHDDPATAEAAVRSFFPNVEADLFDASWKSQLASFPTTPRLSHDDVVVTMSFASFMLKSQTIPDASAIFTNEYVDLLEH